MTKYNQAMNKYAHLPIESYLGGWSGPPPSIVSDFWQHHLKDWFWRKKTLKQTFDFNHKKKSVIGCLTK